MNGGADVNNRQSFDKYISENLDSAYRFAYICTKNKEDAEDVLNESVMRALKGINNLKDAGYIKTWFYRIIINTSATYLKKNRKTVSMDYAPYIADGKCDDYSVLTVESLTRTLDEKYRSVVVLRFCEDMPIKDIAKVLGENENTVKTRLYTALKILKKEV